MYSGKSCLVVAIALGSWETLGATTVRAPVGLAPAPDVSRGLLTCSHHPEKHPP